MAQAALGQAVVAARERRDEPVAVAVLAGLPGAPSPDLSLATGITLPMMAYHLGSDMLHDHGTFVKTAAESIISPPNAIITTNEAEVVRVFKTTLERDGDEATRNALEKSETFELSSDTETLPSGFQWSVLDAEKEEFGFVHDAGPLLFEIFNKENYVTYGTILDSATKPTARRNVRPIPNEVTRDTFEKLGFNRKVGPLRLEPVGDGLSLKTNLTFDGVQYDMVSKNRIAPASVLVPKQIGKPAGFLASVAQTKTAIKDTTIVTRKQPPAILYIIGKALGDALQVASVPPAQIGFPIRLIHNTEDRLNFIRCLVFNVPVVYVHHKEPGSLVRVCEFYPSTEMVSDTTESIYGRVLRSLQKTIQDVIRAYQAVEDAAMTAPFRSGRERYSDEFLRIVRHYKTAVLFHYAIFYAHYAQQAPTVETLKTLRKHYSMLVSQSSELVPRGKLFRANNQTLVQTFILCRATPGECDLGGFSFSEPGTGTGFDNAELLQRILRALDGDEDAGASITQGDGRLTIDSQRLSEYLTGIECAPGDLGSTPGAHIPDKSGAGFGLRGTYTFQLYEDKARAVQVPTFAARPIGQQQGRGVKRAREGVEPGKGKRYHAEVVYNAPVAVPAEPPPITLPFEEYETPIPGITRNTTSDLGLFLQWSSTNGVPEPLRVARTILEIYKVIEDENMTGVVSILAGDYYVKIPDFGPIRSFSEQFQLEEIASVVPYPERDDSIDIWNTFVDAINRSEIARVETRQPRVAPLTLGPVAMDVDGASRRSPPPTGISQQDWDEALDELEAHYAT